MTETVESIKYNIRDWNMYEEYIEVYFHSSEVEDNLRINKSDFFEKGIDFIDIDILSKFIFDNYK